MCCGGRWIAQQTEARMTGRPRIASDRSGAARSDRGRSVRPSQPERRRNRGGRARAASPITPFRRTGSGRPPERPRMSCVAEATCPTRVRSPVDSRTEIAFSLPRPHRPFERAASRASKTGGAHALLRGATDRVGVNAPPFACEPAPFHRNRAPWTGVRLSRAGAGSRRAKQRPATPPRPAGALAPLQRRPFVHPRQGRPRPPQVIQQSLYLHKNRKNLSGLIRLERLDDSPVGRLRIRDISAKYFSAMSAISTQIRHRTMLITAAAVSEAAHGNPGIPGLRDA